jgi:hypothetical protein
MLNHLDDIYDFCASPGYFPPDQFPSGVAPLYGEITRGGVENIIFNFTKQFQDPRTVFYDLGSGFGKMVMHVAVACPIRKAVGVEYIPERYLIATRESEKYNYRTQQPIEFINGDLRDTKFEAPAVVYIDNTSPEMRDLSTSVYDRLPEGSLFLSRNLVAIRRLGLRDEAKSIIAPTTYKKDYEVWAAVKK